MKKSLLALPLVLSLISPAAAQTAAAQTVDPYKTPVLTVAAQSDIKATPDIATVSAGVMTSAATAQAAMQDNAKKMTAVFDALKKAGVADKDIQSAGISIQPQFAYADNEAPRVTAYQASNNVNVILRDLKNIGPVIDALVSQGVNQFNGPNFTVEDQDVVLDKARTEAVKKAKARADLYAAAAGVKIKRIVNISEQSGYNNPGPVVPMMKAMAMDAAPSTPVAPGEVGLSVTVNVTYEIEQ